jgi:hypothetical protein
MVPQRETHVKDLYKYVLHVSKNSSIYLAHFRYFILKGKDMATRCSRVLVLHIHVIISESTD